MSILRYWFLLLSLALAFGGVPTWTSGQEQKPTPPVQALLDDGIKQDKASKLDDAEKLFAQALDVARKAVDRKGESSALYRLGVLAAKRNQYAQAIKFYEDSLAISREISDKPGEAAALKSMGIARYLIGEPQKAVELWQEALLIFKSLGDRLNEAGLLMNLGIVLENTGNPKKALEMYAQARPVFKELKDRISEGHLIVNTAMALRKLGEVDKAYELDQEALAIYHEEKSKSDEANVMLSIAGYHATKGDIQKAIDLDKQALALFREVGNKRGEGMTLSNLGGIYADAGQPELALELYMQALPIRKVMGDKRGEANTAVNLGILYSRSGEPQKGFEYLERGLALARELGDRNFEAAGLLNIAYAYGETKQDAKSQDYFTQALAIYRDLGDKKGEASVLNGLAGILKSQGKVLLAIDNYRKALAAYQEIGDKLRVASITGNLATAYLDLKNLAEAKAQSLQALTLFEQLGDKHGIANTLHSLGVIAERAKKPAESIAYYEKAAVVAQASGNRGYEATILNDLGQAEMKVGRLPAAAKHLSRAVSLVETIRSNFGGYADSKSSYLESRIATYHNYLNVLVRQKRNVEAFELIQKTKARSLLDLLSAGRVDLNASLTPDERQQERDLIQQADTLNAAMVNEGVQNEVGSKKRYEVLKGQLKEVEEKLQTLTNTLYARHPDLVRKRSAQTATLAEIGRILPDDTAVLEYVVLADDNVQLFVVTAKGGKATLSSYKVPGTTKSLRTLASKLHSACADPRLNYAPTSSSLFAALIRPAQASIASKKRLIVCPDGALWDVPFAVLGPKKASFLGERYEIAYAYSATGVQAATTMSSQRATAGQGILVAANPAFGSADRFGDLNGIPGQRPIDTASRPIDTASRPIDTASRPIDVASRAFDTVSRGSGHGKSIPGLPGTQKEADALRKLFPNANVLTGNEAQESTIKASAGGYRYLHLATHGFVNDGSPLLSSVVLAKPSDGSKDDGFLTAREIYGLDLKADMTVLSACNTARGETRTGEGVIGLTWALFVAGCPTQVVSQWAVDDASTAEMMGRFYENLTVRKMGKAQALKEAEKWLRGKNAKYQHPYYWAPFVLNGAWK